MNLLMRIDRWLGGILIIAGILSLIFKWFSNQTSFIYLTVGLVLLVLSLTSDKGKRKQ